MFILLLSFRQQLKSLSNLQATPADLCYRSARAAGPLLATSSAQDGEDASRGPPARRALPAGHPGDPVSAGAGAVLLDWVGRGEK